MRFLSTTISTQIEAASDAGECRAKKHAKRCAAMAEAPEVAAAPVEVISAENPQMPRRWCSAWF